MRDFYEMYHPLADFCEHAGVRKACRPCRQRFDKVAPEATEQEVFAAARAIAEVRFNRMNVSIQKIDRDDILAVIPDAKAALEAARSARMADIYAKDRQALRAEYQAAVAARR